MKKFFIVGFIFVLTLMNITLACAASNAESFRYTGQIAAVADSGGFYVLEIEPDVFAAMDKSLRDLRIFDKDEVETGFTRLHSEAVQEQNNYKELEIINKGVIRESLIYVFTLQDVPAGVETMMIKLDKPEYLVKARVFGSNDNLSWQELGTKTLYGIQGNYNNFDLAGVDYKYIKFEYPMPKGETLAVSSAGYIIRQRVNYETKIKPFSINQTENDKASILTIDLGSANQNTRALKLICDQKNFYRQAVIESSNDGMQWSHVSDFYVYRGTDRSDEDLGISYRLTEARYLRITVWNHDNTPVKFTGAEVELVPVRLLVKGMGAGAPYGVLWGNEQLSSPNYDIEEVFRQSGVDLNSIPMIKLSSYKINKEYQEPEAPFTERYPFLLPLALAVAVMVVGIIQYRSFKKVG